MLDGWPISRRLLWFVLSSFAVSLVSEMAILPVEANLGVDLTWAHSDAGLWLYAIPSALCLMLGIALQIWTRRSIAANFLASLTCFVAPFLMLGVALYVDCRWMTLTCPI